MLAERLQAFAPDMLVPPVHELVGRRSGSTIARLPCNQQGARESMQTRGGLGRVCKGWHVGIGLPSEGRDTL